MVALMGLSLLGAGVMAIFVASLSQDIGFGIRKNGDTTNRS